MLSKVYQNGNNLSGGQIQKILLAKSLYKHDYIFWDEALSGIDSKSRDNIYKNILTNEKYADKTIVFISHHLDSLEYVDSIIFIDQNNKVNKGTLKDLYNNDDFKDFLNKENNYAENK